MTTLQNELIQTTSELSDESIKIVLDYVNTFIIPYDGLAKYKKKDAEKKLKAFMELDARVSKYPPLQDAEKEIQEARDAKYGVMGIITPSDFCRRYID